MMRLQNTMRIIGGAFLGCFSFPMMLVGLHLLWTELLTHIGHPYYVAGTYLSEGVVWLVWGLIVLGLGRDAAYSRKGPVPPLAIGATLVVVAAIALLWFRFPSYYARSAQDKAGSTLLLIRMTQYAWAEKSNRLPASQSELDDFVRAPLDKEHRLWSRYVRDSKPLRYRLVYIADAAGPHLPAPPGAEPGILYCAVSRDQKRFWLTATALDQAVGGKVIIVPAFEQTGPWVVEGQLNRTAEPSGK